MNQIVHASAGKTDIPLYVDLDGTLVKTDIAQELLVRAFRFPEALKAGLSAVPKGISPLKHALAHHVPLDAKRLPYRPGVLDHIAAARAAGRRVVLATAADQRVAEQVAEHLQIFDAVLASTPKLNLKSEAKLAAIKADARAHSDSEAFEYLGDSRADLVIWEAATLRGFAQMPNGAEPLAKDSGQVSLMLPSDGGLARPLIKAMRPHQWSKNVLVFLPLLFAHLYFVPGSLILSLVAFMAFSLCASAVYLVNDLLDIEADRAHATKHLRPFASGRIRPLHGCVVAAVLFLAALALGFGGAGPWFGVVLVLYILMTNIYSFWLKSHSTIDVVILALLYTTRIVAGAAALKVVPSPWILTFSLFFFLSLAYMKRYIELCDVESDDQLPARGYWSSDLNVIRTFGISNAALSLLTLAEYVSAPEIQGRYQSPGLLWIMIPMMMFWSYRTWLKATRGQVGGDPVVFALKDRVSRATGVAVLMVVILANQVNLGWMLP